MTTIAPSPLVEPSMDRGLSVAEAAHVAGIAVSSMRNRIGLGLGPRVRRVGRRVVIRASDLEAWLDSEPQPVRGGAAA